MISRRHFINTSGTVAIGALMLPQHLIFSNMKPEKIAKEFEVIIIGGSYAGLSAAMALGRSLQQVLVIDSGQPCNRFTQHSHNFITHDGEKPGEITKKAKRQVLKYDTVNFLNDLAVSGRKTEDGFMVTTKNGIEFKAKKMVFATGIKDSMPDIKGFAECWGISAIHCPYCHGFEFRSQKIGIMANGKRAFHLASLVNNLTDNITVLTMGKADFEEEQTAKLSKHHLKIIESKVVEIIHQNGHMRQVVYENGNVENFDALYAGLPFTQHSDIPISLGCELTEHNYIKIDAFQKTTVNGVFACGDNSTMMRSIANAVYSGSLTGAMVNMELTEDQF